MTHEEVFPHASFKSHMPFFDGQTLLFCRADQAVEHRVANGGAIWRMMEDNPRLKEHFADLPRYSTIRYRAWKLAYADWSDRQPRPISTGLPTGAVECSPAFYREGKTCHVSFIGGLPAEQGLEYHLYQMSGPSLDRLGPAQCVLPAQARLGFVSPSHVCIGRPRQLILTDRANNRHLLVDYPLSRVYRVTFCADRVESLLITGIDRHNAETTLLYRLDTNATLEVRAPDRVYKSTLCGGRIVFARRDAGDFEDRRLWHGQFSLTPSTVRILRAGLGTK
jgi:hypothetical protein